MKKLLVSLLLAILGTAVLAQAQPDPRDSIIIESKNAEPGYNGAFPGDTAAYVYLKVWITNKDSLTEVSLALIERTIAGSAYMTLGAPKTFDGIVNRYTNTLGQKEADSSGYNNSSPDSFRVAGFFDPLNPATIEPPNSVRKLFWELKFDSVRNSSGVVELDTGRVIQGTFFTNTVPADLPVHFVKSQVRVGSQYVLDPRDSIILESKTVNPGARSGATADTAAYVYLKVYITNRDTLTAISLSLWETSTSGGAYMTLGWPRNFNGTVSRLTNTLAGSLVFFGARYHSNSPDSFYIAGVFDPLDPGTHEPPNAVRKPFWEIKFDTVKANLGTIEFDSGRTTSSTGFTNTIPRDIAVNFVKSIVTVGLKGDLNFDGAVSPADVVLELQCVYLGDIPPAGQSACDLNCDGQVTAADFTAMLNYKYLTGVWPC